MNVGKFLLNVVVAYVLFGVLYTVTEMWLMADQMAAMKALMKPESELGVIYVYYLVETIIFVWLFGRAAGSGDVKEGILFGVMLGLYMSAANATMMVSLKDMPEGLILPSTASNIVIFAIVGAVLAVLQARGWGPADTGKGAAEEDT